jgi:RimJ/RimL family protein N-acetyltransferase
MHVKVCPMNAIDHQRGRATPTPASELLAHRCAGRSGYPSHLVEAKTLRDGTSLTIRPICSDDFGLEAEFISRLSARSGYQRLLSPRKLTRREIQRFVDIDYARELALIALAVVDHQVRQVGVARYAPEHDGLSHDFGIVVADEWQGRGLGEALLASLVSAAANAGVQHLTGLTLADNHAMRRLARRLGFHIESEPGDATVVRLRKALRGEPSGRRRSNVMAPAPAVASAAFPFAFDQQDFEVGSWDHTDIWMS